MFSHVEIDDTSIHMQGQWLAKIEVCGDAKVINAYRVKEVQEATKKILSVAVFDKSLFEDGYASTKASLKSEDKYNLAAACRKYDLEVDSYINRANSRYAEITNKRRADMTSILSSAGSFQTSTPSIAYNPSSYSAPQQPSYGVQQPSTSNYLINTPGGYRPCSVTSNVARCY